MASTTKTVLLVDDETPFIQSLVEGLTHRAPELEILTAADGRQAVRILRERRVDLIVTDLSMPEMDGFELLAWLSTNQPENPVIVMTAYGTPLIESRVEQSGAACYLEKPLDIDTLAGRIEEALAGVASGRIAGISLPALLQLLAAERKTCTLLVRSRGLNGTLYLWDGELVGARSGAKTGVEAAHDIVCWGEPEVEIRYTVRPELERDVSQSLNEVLLEAFRRHDEQLRGDFEEDLDGLWLPETPLELEDDGRTAERPDDELFAWRERVPDLEKILARLMKLAGAMGVGLFTQAGQLVASTTQEMLEMDMLGERLTGLRQAARATAEQLGLADSEQVDLRTTAGVQIFIRTSGKSRPFFTLILLCSLEAKLGLVGLRLDQAVASIRSGPDPGSTV